MERNHNSDISYRIKVEETVDIASNSSALNIAVQVKNTSGKVISCDFADFLVTVSGTEIINRSVNLIIEPRSGAWHDAYSNWLISSYTAYHSPDGSGSFSVSASIKGDELLGIYYRTLGSLEARQDLTKIDQSYPTLLNTSVSADRYGLNASAKFTASHASYNLTKVRFELKCLTQTQAKNRVGKSTQANTSSYVYNSSRNDYTLILEKTSNLSKSNSITFDLDCNDEETYPLTSGKTYEYSVILTALNGKKLKKNDSFTVPQKVTGITCDSVLNIKRGESAQLNYTVIPTNAEEQTVTFTSSDTSVATVDTNGVVTAKNITAAFASAVITVRTKDGSYTAKCTVNVTTTEAFPYLPTVTQYLTAELFASIISAAAIIRGELIDAGATVESLNGVSIAGKNEPVINIMPAFRNVEADCQKLRAAASVLGLSTDPLPSTVQTINKQNTNWIIVVNNWINFLNNLHNQLGGG
ncbi:MAG: Ig-like domain-containing protein [Clostridia bacterium]|nr:Ig-like domain-containing protein [Clostridia bacterium]